MPTLITDQLPASALLGQQHQVITPFIPQGHLPIPLLAGHQLTFQLIPRDEVITAIRLRFGTYCRHNDSHLTLILQAQQQCELHFHASYLPDNDSIDLILPLPYPCFSEQPITLTIYSADATPEQAVALWCSPKLPSFSNQLTLEPLHFPLPNDSNSQPTISIIIPVFNKALYTYNCLLSLQACDAHLTPEIIIVDNASTDETRELLSKLQGSVKIITNPENQGFVQACRQGAAAATGELLLFLNNDTQVTPGWLTSLVEQITADPDIGIVGSKLIYPDGHLQEAGGIIFNDASGYNYGRHQDPSDPRYLFPRPVDYCSGASLMIKRNLWQQLGGFDLRFAPAYYEDTDLCFSARQAGYQVIYCPDSQVVHYEGITAGTDINSGYKAYQQINHQHFLEKWQSVLNSQHLSPQTDPDLAARRLITSSQITDD